MRNGPEAIKIHTTSSMSPINVLIHDLVISLLQIIRDVSYLMIRLLHFKKLFHSSCIFGNSIGHVRNTAIPYNTCFSDNDLLQLKSVTNLVNYMFSHIVVDD